VLFSIRVARNASPFQYSVSRPEQLVCVCVQLLGAAANRSVLSPLTAGLVTRMRLVCDERPRTCRTGRACMGVDKDGI
jgi:hypothetical protein